MDEDIKSKVIEWIGEEGKVIYWWKRDGAYFVVCNSETHLYCLRLWKYIEGQKECMISQDHSINLLDLIGANTDG